MKSFCSLTLAGALLGLLLTSESAPAQSVGVFREVYSSIGGTAVIDLTSAPTFPDSPTSTNIVTDFFEAPTDVDDNYGQRMRALITAPTTGNYVFWIASDDNSELWLSTNEDPATKTLIANVPGWTGSRQWGNYAEQQSAAKPLVAGRRYYIEALMKEGGGGDNLAVRWQLPSLVTEEPIPGSRLIPYMGAPTSKPQIATEPGDLTVVEGQSATFTVQVSNPVQVSYQWRRDPAVLPGETGSSYTLPIASLSDNNALFSCILSNSLGTNVTRSAKLSVTPDKTPPTIVRVYNVGPTTLSIIFSEPIDPTTGTASGSYTIGGLGVTLAAFGADTRTILLTTAAMTYGNSYTLTVNNVQDRAAAHNPIAPNTQIAFVALAYAPQDIGAPAPGGTIVAGGNGYDMTASGSDIGGAADQFSYGYEQRTGDFDLKVRVQSLGLANVWTKAGLMARENLNANSRFVSALATPSLSGCFLEYRDPAGAASTTTGTFPPNYPNTWLRLQRVGNLFTAYAGYDGQTWTQLGAVTIALPSKLYFGMAVSSHAAGQTTVAKFRDLTSAAGGVVAPLPATTEPLGPSSRKTGLVVSEIMYKPAPRADTNILEFVELFNSNPFFEDISGFRLAGDIDFTFPPGTVLPGGGFLVVAKSPTSLQNVYGLSAVLGPYSGSLKRSGVVRLRSQIDAILLEVPYANHAPWPVAADGTGHSLVLAHPSFGEGQPQAWAISDLVGGSPGSVDSQHVDPQRAVVINELLAHTDDPLYDYIELYNHSNQQVDLSGCILTDDVNTNKFIIPAGTKIPARGFVYFDQIAMGFSLKAAGETLYFKNADGSRVLDAYEYEAQENSVSYGRWPDGAADWYPMATRTPGLPNSNPLVRDIVINEIMYNPISGASADEYLELYNQGNGPVDMSGWKFIAGPNYTFPSNTVLASHNYLVVARNLTNLLAHYANLNTNNTVGNFGSSLTHDNGRIALAMPDLVVSTNTLGVVSTNKIHIVVDEVTFGRGGRWGNWANGGGSSLELIDPRSNHRLPGNWADSDETAKATWTTIEATGTLDNGASYSGAIDNLQVVMLGEGECLLDEVEVRPGAAGANLLANPSFEPDLTGWTPQGNHVRSTLESGTGAKNTTHSLHIRASARGDTGANRIRTPLTGPLGAGATATIRAQVKWLAGWPEMVLRVNGNFLEATGRFNVPTNLGTPGAANSRAVANAGPAIYAVAHSPVLPAAAQAVVVTARVQDPDGVSALQVKYRNDTLNSSTTTLTMVDNGTGGDAVAGDGIYSATIPGQAAGQLVAFYVQATDNFATKATTRFPNDAPTRECLVRFGDPAPTSGFGTYRIWMTQKNVDTWINRPSLSNERVEGTFVYDNVRAIYNMSGKYAGSPYHQGFGSPLTDGHYSLEMPMDDLVLGTENFNKIHAPGNGPFDDDTIQREQTSYWMVRSLDLPWNYRRYVNIYFNGSRRGSFMEDTQTPGTDVIDEHFPNDANGNLYKLQPWFEFDDMNVTGGNGAGFNNNSWCTLNNYTTTGGGKKLARYRWNYLTRAANGTANDYTNVFALIDAANNPNNATYLAGMDAIVDLEEWARIFAVEHAVGNWDSFGNVNAQNMYGYKPTNGKWTLFIWDYNIVLGLGNYSDGPTGDDLFKFQGADGAMPALNTNPTFRRAWWRAYKELATGAMANVGPIVDAKYAAFQADGVTVSSPNGMKGWINSRRNYLNTQLATVNATFGINGSSTVSTGNNLFTLTGNAPVEVKTIEVNGISYPVTWSSVNGWSLKIPLPAAVNALTVQAFDRKGQPLAGQTTNLTVTYTGAVQSPVGNLIINEIMYNPIAPNASYVEIFNKSATFTFDLSNYRLNGVDFTFPEGATIAPNRYAVVAKDAVAFAAAFGNVPVAGEYNGQLDNGGETLSLIQPGATPAQDVIVDQVRYDSLPPWPTEANGTGPSLQLIDPNQDNSRVANWTAVTTNAPVAPLQWEFVTQTGTATSSKFYIYLNTAGDVYLDDITLVAGSTPGGANLLPNGDFESALTGPWTVSANLSASVIDTTTKHSGTGSLHLVASSGGSSQGSSIWQIAPSGVVNGNTYTLSYWYLPSTNGGPLTLRQSGSTTASQIYSSISIAPPPPQQQTNSLQYTPGAVNSTKQTLAAFPTLWINEVQPDNVTGITDNAAEHEPWLELYNSGASAITLTNFYLANNFTNLGQWTFPAGATINPGEYKTVWADGQPGQTSGSQWHTSFRLAPASNSVVLAWSQAGQTGVLDYVNYKYVGPDRSYGSYPNGQSISRQIFHLVTPAGTNNPAAAAVPVVINEWMASNVSTLADPADGHFDDWFELYNDSDAPVDLSGFYLTGTLTNKTQWQIPANTTIAARGYLLVWADKNTSQNGFNSDLHTNFKLSSGGDSIGLFAFDGTPIDTVTFGPQTDDVSQGHFPDGTGAIYDMPVPTPRAANTLPAANQPPVLAPISNQTINEGVFFTFTATATDPNAGDTLTYSLDPGAPAGATINGASGAFTWTPTEAQGPNAFPITVRVTDNGTPALSHTRSFTLTVAEVNSRPTLDLISDQAASEGSLLTFTATAHDSDIPTNTLTFTLGAGAPTGAAITPRGVFTWTPDETQGGISFPITVIVTDDGVPGLSASQLFHVNVAEVNSKPTLTFIADKTASEGTMLTFTATATDTDVPTNTLTFTLGAGAPAGASITAQGVFTWTPAETQGGSNHALTITVTDNGIPPLSASQLFHVNVAEVNEAPVLNAIGDQFASVGNLLTFTATASDVDVPTNVLTFTLDAGAPTGAVINGVTGVFTWTPTTGQAPSTNTLTVRVTDNGVPPYSDAKPVRIVVSAAPLLKVSDIVVNPAGTVLTWSTEAGHSYMVQSKNLLTDATWVDLGQVNATSASSSYTNASSGATQRFYQIKLLP